MKKDTEIIDDVKYRYVNIGQTAHGITSEIRILVCENDVHTLDMFLRKQTECQAEELAQKKLDRLILAAANRMLGR